MRATFPDIDQDILIAHIEAAPETATVRSLGGSYAEASADTTAAVIGEAVRFARTHLHDLDEIIDRRGAQANGGRVVLAPEHRMAWQAYAAAGWSAMDQAVEWGGQGLPRFLTAAAQEVFDRASMAFGMLAVPQRSACRLIGQFGSPAMRAEWLPRLTAGDWAATICISEPDAGSDVGRIRTTARPTGDGSWSISGEKCWISYGDHDLTDRIGHCMLARTTGDAQGLSLFLVPDTFARADGAPERNAIAVRRVEDKLGLHGSPTCAIGLEEARGWLIGEEGRGLAQMFVMITNMRLSVGVTGAALAGGCLDTALDYAETRLQGSINGKTVAIAEHADIQRQLLGMAGRTEALRGLVFALANQADLASAHPDSAVRDGAQDLVQWLLPIVKTIGGETAFDVADDALQILGGAGYTREWPVEQALRDARVLTLFEGTSGIQAHDLVHRRLLRGDAKGMARAQALAREALGGTGQDNAVSLAHCLDLLDDAAQWFRAPERHSRDLDAGATAFLHLAGLGAMGWAAARLARLRSDRPAHRRIAAAAAYFLAGIGDSAASLHAQAIAGSARLETFRDVRSGRR